MHSLRNLGLAAALLALESRLVDAACADNADCCVKSWKAYQSSTIAWTNEPVVKKQTWWWETVTSVNSNVQHTTLCDGFPRALVPYQTIESSFRTTPTPKSTTTISSYRTEPYPSPSPTCSIGEAKCAALISAYLSSSSAANTNPNLPYPTYPPCNLACPTTTGGYCRLGAEDATLYYWPVTTQTGDFCAPTRTILTNPASTPPRSTVLSGTTFISPTAYIRLASASGRVQSARYGGTDCGPVRTNILLSFADPAQIRTVTYKTETPANTRDLTLADFNTPAPASLFFTNRVQERNPVTRCTATPCTTTLQPAPTPPRLSVPTQLASVDPKWVACSPLPFVAELKVVPLAPEVPNWPKVKRAARRAVGGVEEVVEVVEVVDRK